MLALGGASAMSPSTVATVLPAAVAGAVRGAPKKEPKPPDARWDSLAAGSTVKVGGGELRPLNCRTTNLPAEECSASNPLYMLDSAAGEKGWTAALGRGIRDHNSAELLSPAVWSFLHGLHGAVLFYEREGAGPHSATCEKRQFCEIEWRAGLGGLREMRIDRAAGEAGWSACGSSESNAWCTPKGTSPLVGLFQREHLRIGLRKPDIAFLWLRGHEVVRRNLAVGTECARSLPPVRRSPCCSSSPRPPSEAPPPRSPSPRPPPLGRPRRVRAPPPQPAQGRPARAAAPPAT